MSLYTSSCNSLRTSHHPIPPAFTNAQTLPTAVFPQYPELFHDLDEQDIAAHETVLRTGKRHWPANRILKTMRGWMFPYFKSRLSPGVTVATASFLGIAISLELYKRRCAALAWYRFGAPFLRK